MRCVSLPISHRTTSALGFGTGFLTAQWEAKHSLALVRTALDAGIRHFDTAPSYGAGHAEDLLGHALGSRREECTITTKVGIARPASSLSRSLLRVASGPLRRAIRHFRPAVDRSAAGSQTRVDTVFTAEFVRASLAESLRRLRTTRVELLLLHEARADDISDELLKVLEERRRQGDFAALGLATDPADIAAITAAHPDVFEVLQCHWSVLDARQPPFAGHCFRITHRALMRAFGPMREWLSSDADARRRLTEDLGVDLSNDETLAQALIAAALSQNPGGIVLVASHNRDRIVHNARTADDLHAVAGGRRLVERLLEEANCPFRSRPAKLGAFQMTSEAVT